MTMGERITALRKGRGMTQEQLAERLSVTRQSVSKWELDQSTPDVGFAVALCELFGVSLDYLVRGSDTAGACEAPPEAPSPTAEMPAEIPAEKDDSMPAAYAREPLTGAKYARLFGVLLLLTLEICLHVYTFAVLFDRQRDFTDFFVFLFAIVIPLPAVYLATNHWQYGDARQALRHLWLISVCVAVVGNVLFIGGYECYCLYVYGELDWQTAWCSVGYRFLVGEIMTLAVLLPVLVCFRRKRWLCWLAYFLSWSAFVWSVYALDGMESLLSGGRFGWYWALAYAGGYFLAMGLVLLSQVIVHRLLRADTTPLEPLCPTPLRMWQVAVIGVMSALAVVSVAGGLYYALLLTPFPSEYLPLAYPLIPLLTVTLMQRRQAVSARAAWRIGAWVLLIFLPLMLWAHVGLQEFFYRFLIRQPIPNPGSYCIVSGISALVGSAVTLPALVALRKRPLACIGVAVAVMLLTVAAMLLLPAFSRS